MGSRSRSTLLAVVPIASALAFAPAADAQEQPLRASLGETRCADVSALTETSPVLAAQFEDPAHVPTVLVDVRGNPEAKSIASFTATVDGAPRANGSVAPEGLVSTQVALPNHRDAHVVVRSGDQVVLDRFVAAPC